MWRTNILFGQNIQRNLWWCRQRQTQSFYAVRATNQTDGDGGIRGPPFNIQGGGGGVGVFVADKLFISTGFGGALKISHYITCLYRTVFEVKYLFHAKSARNYLFQKNSSPPPWKSNGGPLITHYNLRVCGVMWTSDDNDWGWSIRLRQGGGGGIRVQENW